VLEFISTLYIFTKLSGTAGFLPKYVICYGRLFFSEDFSYKARVYIE
jgi:hypothetical protein